MHIIWYFVTEVVAMIYFSVVTSFLNIGSVKHAHASNDSKSVFYDVLTVAPSRMLQQSSHAKFSLDLHLKQKT